MSTKPEALEYWGRLPVTVDPDDVEVDLGAGPCAAIGHTWPKNGRGPCERCGKPSSLPENTCCRHGAPRRGQFGGHDCAYSDARDALVRYAELAANADCPRALQAAGASDAEMAIRRAEWDGSYHRHMARLVEAARALAGRAARCGGVEGEVRP